MITANEVVLNWKAGDVIYQEAFTRGGVPANYTDGQGVLRSAIGSDRRWPHYINDIATDLREKSSTNIVVSPRDLSDVAWVKTSMAFAVTQVGIDGVANAATKLFASGPNATILQTVTLASSSRAMSAYVKRFPGGGTGVINMTTDGGATWVPIAVTSQYQRFAIPAQTLANPSFGFQIVTTGDSIVVDYVQNETGVNPSSPIVGTRSGDNSASPWNYNTTQPLTFYAKFVEQTTDTAQRRMFRVGNSDSGSIILYAAAGLWRMRHNNGVGTTESQVAVTPAVGDVVELRGVYRENGSCLVAITVNGGTETLGSNPALVAPPANWNGTPPTLQFTPAAGSSAIWGLISFKIIVGEKTLTECRMDISPGSYSGGYYLAEKGHVAPPAPTKQKARRPTAAQEHAARVAREFAARQAELKAAEDRRIENARKLWGASETNQPATLRIPKAEKRSSGPKILRLPRSK